MKRLRYCVAEPVGEEYARALTLGYFIESSSAVRRNRANISLSIFVTGFIIVCLQIVVPGIAYKHITACA
jgi:hypothetical protein